MNLPFLTLKFRNVDVVDGANLPARGPVVLIANRATHYLSYQAALARLPRQFNKVYDLGATIFPTRDLASIEKDITANLEAAEALFFKADKVEHLSLISRVLLAVEKKNDFRLGTEVFVLTSHCSSPQPVRRDLLAKIHKLETWRSHLQHYREDENEAITSMQHALRELFEGVNDAQVSFDRRRFLERLGKIYALQFGNHHEAAPPPSLDRLIRAIETKPQLVQELSQKVDQLLYAFKVLEIRDRSLRPTRKIADAYNEVVKKILLQGCLAPLALWGILNHYLIYKVTDWFTFWTFQTVKNPLRWQGMLLLPAYALQFWLFGTLVSWGAASLYLLSLPFSGFAAVLLVEKRSQLRQDIRFMHLLKQPRELHTELMHMRWEILEHFATERSYTSSAVQEADVRNSTGREAS